MSTRRMGEISRSYEDWNFTQNMGNGEHTGKFSEIYYFVTLNFDLNGHVRLSAGYAAVWMVLTNQFNTTLDSSSWQRWALSSTCPICQSACSPAHST